MLPVIIVTTSIIEETYPKCNSASSGQSTSWVAVEAGCECGSSLTHPYSPNLVPSDFHLFPMLKKKRKTHLGSDIWVWWWADCCCGRLVRGPGPGCSKLTTSLVNVPLKFQTLISEICHYFLLKKCEKLLQCKSFSHFFNKKFQCIWL